MPSPYTTARATRCKFWPLIPWYQGTRDAPKGAICLVCVGVPLTSNADKDNADNAVHYVAFEYYYSLSLYKSRYTEVFSGGGWQMKVGSLKKCAVYFKSNPIKLHECLVSICSVAMYCMTVDVYLISMIIYVFSVYLISMIICLSVFFSFWGGGDEVAAPARSSNPFQE